MKNSLISLAWILLSTVVFAEDEPVGRYQLVSGTVQVAGKGTVVNTPVILRLDTRTGTVWNYAAGLGKDGRYTEFWSEISEHVTKPAPKAP